VAAAGHELKTPLALILALAGRIERRGAAAPEDLEDVRRIHEHARTLVHQVDDLLGAMRPGAPEPPAAEAACDAGLLVHKAAADFSAIAEVRCQRFEVDAPASAWARTDGDKLLLILSNLLGNAMRYTPVGGVTRCSLRIVEGRRLRLEVADSGPGIPVGSREVVFERYRRINGASRTRADGAGLGLAIVRDLVTAQRGTVTVGDAPEGGALFAVELPCDTAVPPRRARTP